MMREDRRFPPLPGNFSAVVQPRCEAATCLPFSNVLELGKQEVCVSMDMYTCRLDHAEA